MFSERPIEQPLAPTTLRGDQLVEEVVALEGTIELIELALTAEDFNDGDRTEVERNREFFQARYEAILRLADHSIKAAQIAA